MPARILRYCVDSERLAALSYEAETLFFRLLQVADDYGLAPAAPMVVGSTCYPAGRRGQHVLTDDVSRWLDELEAAGLIRRTEVGGKPVLQIIRFGQRLRSRPRHIAPDEWITDALRWSSEAQTSGLPQSAADCRTLRPYTVYGYRHTDSRKTTGTGTGTAHAHDTSQRDASGERPVPEPSRELSLRCQAGAGAGADQTSDATSDICARLELLRDPQEMARLVTGDGDRRSMTGWRRLYTRLHQTLGESALDVWRETCSAYVHEVASGERPRNPGAALTARLKRLLEHVR